MKDSADDTRAAVWLTVAQLCADDEARTGTKYAPAFVEALCHVVCSQTETMGADLECFAKHGKRSKISVDDVKLCVRRNQDLLQRLADMSDK